MLPVSSHSSPADTEFCGGDRFKGKQEIDLFLPLEDLRFRNFLSSECHFRPIFLFFLSLFGMTSPNFRPQLLRAETAAHWIDSLDYTNWATLRAAGCGLRAAGCRSHHNGWKQSAAVIRG